MQNEALGNLRGALDRQLALMSQTSEQKSETLRVALDSRLAAIQQDNNAKLEQMRATVEEKLQTTLERRLGDSFKIVSENLQQVHIAMGEMRKLAGEIGSLQTLMSNVKNRGGWGEFQLSAILEQFLSPEQYAKNVRPRGNGIVICVPGSTTYCSARPPHGPGRIYWEDETYSDRQVLLHMPKGFDIRRPGLLVVFFHGHGAKLADDVYLRQQVPAQISSSGVNAVLVAPQLAVNAADSSAGKFWQPGAFARFLGEAAQHLAKLHGDPRSVRSFASMPVVIVAYSGGYLATAWSVHHGGLGKRLRGVVLFDALYGELDMFADWITRQKSAFFVSTYAAPRRRGTSSCRRCSPTARSASPPRWSRACSRAASPSCPAPRMPPTRIS